MTRSLEELAKFLHSLSHLPASKFAYRDKPLTVMTAPSGGYALAIELATAKYKNAGWKYRICTAGRDAPGWVVAVYPKGNNTHVDDEQMKSLVLDGFAKLASNGTMWVDVDLI